MPKSATALDERKALSAQLAEALKDRPRWFQYPRSDNAQIYSGDGPYEVEAELNHKSGPWVTVFCFHGQWCWVVQAAGLEAPPLEEGIGGELEATLDAAEKAFDRATR